MVRAVTRPWSFPGLGSAPATYPSSPKKFFGLFTVLIILTLQFIECPALLSARGQGLSTGRAATGNAQLAGGFCCFRGRGKGVRGNVSPGASELQRFMRIIDGIIKNDLFDKKCTFSQVNPQKWGGIIDFNYSVLNLIILRFFAPNPARGLCPGAPAVTVSAPVNGRC